MKRIFTLVGILLLASCTKDEMFLEIEEQIQKQQLDTTSVVVTPPPSTASNNPAPRHYKLHKESYLNQRSGVVFWFYAGWGSGSSTDETFSNFAGGEAYHDVNGDGYSDIIAVNNGQNDIPSINIYINDGTNARFIKNKNLINGSTVGLSGHKIVTTDVNNDGIGDFIAFGVYEPPVGDYDGNFTVLIGKSDGTFDVNNIPNPNKYWFHNGAAGDLNGDGNVDVIAADFIWYGDGKGNFINSNITLTSLGAESTVVYEILDMNNDGWNDIIAGVPPLKGNTSLIILNQSGNFNKNNNIKIPSDINTGISDIELYDIDKDGDLDFIELRVDPRGSINDGISTEIFVYLNNNLKFTYSPNHIQNSRDGNWLNGSTDKTGYSHFKFDDIDNDGEDEILPENHHDGYNPNNKDKMWNALKKIDGTWKKVFIKFGK